MSTRKAPKAAKTAAALRRIAVHVEEPQPGRFAWVLSELSDEAEPSLTVIAQAGKPVRSYQQAMAQGLWALQSMVDDLELGPREAAAGAASSRGASAGSRKKASEREDREHEGDAHEDEDKDREEDEAADSPPPKGTSRTAFGFGLIG